VLHVQTYWTQLNELILGSEQNMSQDRYPYMDLLSPTSSCCILVDIDLSECFIMYSSLEVLILEAMLKLYGRKIICSLFTVGKGFQIVLGSEKGGFLVLQTTTLAFLMESYRAYNFFEGFFFFVYAFY